MENLARFFVNIFLYFGTVIPNQGAVKRSEVLPNVWFTVLLSILPLMVLKLSFFADKGATKYFTISSNR